MVNLDALVQDYYSQRPDPTDKAQRITFGTSGHRGTSEKTSFNELHVLAITQAVCDYREKAGYDGPLLVGKDTHRLSEEAEKTALRVLAANGVEAHIQKPHEGLCDGYTPTPVISRAIIRHNAKGGPKADGILLTPSHNPPEDGGFKYNPEHGGPAEGDVTKDIEGRANEILAALVSGDDSAVKCAPTIEEALAESNIKIVDFVPEYVEELQNVVDMQAIADAKIHIGADPLGGAAIGYWKPIADRYGLNLDLANQEVEVVDGHVDKTFSFMPKDHDGKTRMDCSSSAAMANLIGLISKFDLAFANDPDSDRHGIVTKSGLMNPNHYLAVAIEYLFTHRKRWSDSLVVGKTLVSSGMIDRVAELIGRDLIEVPVGFKFLATGLDAPLESGEKFGFGGEESAGASFLQFDGSVWTTDKDGIILNLLAAEILAKTGQDPSEHYQAVEKQFGKMYYTRVNADATLEEQSILKALSPEAVRADTMAGDPILPAPVGVQTNALGNSEPIGGLKVVSENGWFAARPSGTEPIYKIYAESYVSEEHLQRILDEAKEIVAGALEAAR